MKTETLSRIAGIAQTRNCEAVLRPEGLMLRIRRRVGDRQAQWQQMLPYAQLEVTRLLLHRIHDMIDAGEREIAEMTPDDA